MRAELSTVLPHVYSVVCDVSDPDAVRGMILTVHTDHGCPDILLNNAGFAAYRAFDQSSMNEIEHLIGVNLLGTLRCIRGFLPGMMERRSGHIEHLCPPVVVAWLGRVLTARTREARSIPTGPENCS